MTTTLVPNGGFETAGSEPGSASGWSFTETNSLEEYAGFSVGAFDVAWEGFELGWGNDDYQSEFDPGDVESVIFNDGTVVPTAEIESFEAAWSDNQNWSDELVSVAFADFDSGSPEPFEDHEEEWDSNEDWIRYFSEPAFEVIDTVGPGLAPAGWYRVTLLGEVFPFYLAADDDPRAVAVGLRDLIDASGLPVSTVRDDAMIVLTPNPTALDLGLVVEGPESGAIILRSNWPDDNLDRAEFNSTTDLAEGFEREWRSNENFEFSLGATVAAEFDTAADPFEDFEEEWPTEVMQIIV